MYASITNFIAQNEMQMDMWIEFFKSQSAKLMTDAGAIQISIIKTASNKAVSALSHTLSSPTLKLGLSEYLRITFSKPKSL